MIQEQEVKMVVNQYNIDYYHHILHRDLSVGERIKVPVDLLPPTSGVKVTVRCEYCGNFFRQSYRRYVAASKTGKHCCGNCRCNKVMEVTQQRYGTRCTLKLPHVHEKMIQNNLRKYGTKHSVTPESYKKRGETMMSRYGCEYSLQSEELRSKANATMYALGHCTVFSSKQQEYLCGLLHGVSNYPCGPYHVDCYLPEKGIGVEYSGKGHDLCVRTGHLTQKQFDGRERARRSYFRNHGMPIIEFVSHTDILPSDEDIIKYFDAGVEKIESGEMYVKIVFPK